MGMFSLPHLNNMRDLTNKLLDAIGMQNVSSGEILKFLGMLIIKKGFQFSSFSDLRHEIGPKYIVGPSFAKIMSPRSIQLILANFCFSHNSKRWERPLDDRRWILVSGSFKGINENHRHFIF